MTGLILLCLLVSTQQHIQRFWLGIQLADIKMLKWNQFSLLARGYGLLFEADRGF